MQPSTQCESKDRVHGKLLRELKLKSFNQVELNHCRHRDDMRRSKASPRKRRCKRGWKKSPKSLPKRETSFSRRRETEVLAENRQALGFLTNFKPTHPYVRVDIPRTPVESLRGCSSRTGRDRRRVRQMARRPSPRAGRRSSLSL